MNLAMRNAVVLVLVAIAMLLASCAMRTSRRAPRTVDPLRISEIVDVGDPARRASMRIVVKGLEADSAGQPDRALGTYEKAIRVDPNNPYAYLAIARHHAQSHDPEWALSFLDKADSLFRGEGGAPPRVEPNLIGLRGQALYASGRIDDGLPLLEEAWSLSPDVWTDGQLSAAELR